MYIANFLSKFISKDGFVVYLDDLCISMTFIRGPVSNFFVLPLVYRLLPLHLHLTLDACLIGSFAFVQRLTQSCLLWSWRDIPSIFPGLLSFSKFVWAGLCEYPSDDGCDVGVRYIRSLMQWDFVGCLMCMRIFRILSHLFLLIKIFC